MPSPLTAAGRLVAGKQLDRDVGRVGEPRQAERSIIPRARHPGDPVRCRDSRLGHRPHQSAGDLLRHQPAVDDPPAVNRGGEPVDLDPLVVADGRGRNQRNVRAERRACCEPHAASAPAAVPLGELRGGLQAAGETRVAAEHRHAEGERLEARGVGQLVDEAFGEEAIFALRRSAHVTGIGRNTARLRPARRGSHRAERHRRAQLLRACPVRPRRSAGRWPKPRPSPVATRICHAAVIPPCPGSAVIRANAPGDPRSWVWLALCGSVTWTGALSVRARSTAIGTASHSIARPAGSPTGIG